MNKTYFRIRCIIAWVTGILCFLAFFSAFYPVKIFDLQLTALLQRFLVDVSLTAAILLSALLLLTLFFGRVYCSTLCPFGLLQEFLMLFFRRRTGYRQNRPAKYFLAAVFFGMLLGGTVAVIRLIDPYALFGSAASGALPGLAAFGFVAVPTWFFGRIFCANICPVGTLLGLLAIHARKKILINSEQCVSCGLCATGCPTGSIDFRSKTVNNETCIKCFKCLTVCRQNGIDYRSEPVAAVPFSPERRRLLTAAAAAAVLSVAVKGGIRLSRTIADKTKKVILPAGAGNPGEFASRCLNCNLCVAGCPMRIIKKASADYPAVHIDYAESFCDYDCHNCSAVCPSGAIKKISLAEKRKTQIGLAAVDENACIKCGICVMKCPRQIICRKNGGFPQIDAKGCIGCGACQNTCPVNAITVIPVETQKIL